MIPRIAIAVLAIFALASCQEENVVTVPKAATMTGEALGYYCQMNLSEHDGPKAQIHLAGSQHPIWFSQVRDAVAFTRLPEETADVVAVYVSDMGKAQSWAEPGNDNWIVAADAWFVVASRLNGGMGAPEAVPFGDEAAAIRFMSEHGGRVVRLADIPDDYVLGPVELPQEDLGAAGRDTHDDGGHKHGGNETQ